MWSNEEEFITSLGKRYFAGSVHQTQHSPEAPLGHPRGAREWLQVHLHQGRQGGHHVQQHQARVFPTLRRRNDHSPTIPPQGKRTNTKKSYEFLYISIYLLLKMPKENTFPDNPLVFTLLRYFSLIVIAHPTLTTAHCAQ